MKTTKKGESAIAVGRIFDTSLDVVGTRMKVGMMNLRSLDPIQITIYLGDALYICAVCVVRMHWAPL